MCLTTVHSSQVGSHQRSCLFYIIYIYSPDSMINNDVGGSIDGLTIRLPGLNTLKLSSSHISCCMKHGVLAEDTTLTLPHFFTTPLPHCIVQ